MPQLVSANLNTYSLKYYVSDDNEKIKEVTYDSLLKDNAILMSNFTRSNIIPDIREINGNNLITYLFII